MRSFLFCRRHLGADRLQRTLFLSHSVLSGTILSTKVVVICVLGTFPKITEWLKKEFSVADFRPSVFYKIKKTAFIYIVSCCESLFLVSTIFIFYGEEYVLHNMYWFPFLRHGLSDYISCLFWIWCFPRWSATVSTNYSYKEWRQVSIGQ